MGTAPRQSRPIPEREDYCVVSRRASERRTVEFCPTSRGDTVEPYRAPQQEALHVCWKRPECKCGDGSEGSSRQGGEGAARGSFQSDAG